MQTNIRKGHLWQNNSNRFQNLNAFCVYQYLTFLMWSAVNESLFLRGEKIEIANEVYIKVPLHESSASQRSRRWKRYKGFHFVSFRLCNNLETS